MNLVCVGMMHFEQFLALIGGESVKLIQYICGALDLKNSYDIQHWQFVSNVDTKVAYLNRFFVARELENHVCIYLEHSYRVSDGESVSSAVYN